MKPMQKKSLPLIITAILILFSGCAKKNITVINEPELERSLYGSWSIKNKLQQEIWSEPNTENEKYLGTIVVLNTNIITFSQNQEFAMQNISTLDSMNLYDDAYISEEDIKLQIESNVTVKGKFSVNKNYLELTSETVLIDNNSYTAEDYAQINSDFGSLVQTQKWALEDNSLILLDLNGNEIAAFTKE